VQNQINILGQELEMLQKTNIEEIVKVEVSMIDSSKSPVKSGPAQKENNVIKCDHCSFKCEKEEILVTHVREDQEEYPYCYFCEKYFGTDKSLKDHNKQNHNTLSN
jgi:Pyruvate/2-oxoacid:ferredoxin oxidoreductase delta subunit